jgi:RNA polymerase sigma-70 factor (ECF subfamily)
MASIAASTALLPFVKVQNPQSHEEQLVRRAAGGDTEAFCDLLKPCEPMLYRVALSMLGNPAVAEEVCQEAALKALRSIDRFRGQCKFSTWIAQIVMNEARMHLRKEKPGMVLSIDDVNEERSYPIDPADTRELASSAVERRELRSALVQAIQTLPEIYREVFVLRDVQQLNVAETAKVLGLSLEAVKTRLFRARHRMRLAIQRWERTGSVGLHRPIDATLVEHVVAFLEAY